MVRFYLVIILLLLLLSCDDTAHYCSDSSCSFLSDLQAADSSGGLEPSFRSDLFHYSLFLPRGSDSVSLIPWSSCPYADIFIEDQLVLSGAPSEDLYFNESRIVEILFFSSSGQEVLYSVEVFELVEDWRDIAIFLM